MKTILGQFCFDVYNNQCIFLHYGEKKNLLQFGHMFFLEKQMQKATN
jgi:hypothetical protein